MDEVYQLEDEYQKIIPGETDRKKVVDILGNPILNSKNLKFDVFQRTVSKYRFAYLVLQAGYSSFTIDLYTLVTYDKNDIVVEISYTRYYSGTDWYYSRTANWNSRMNTSNISFIFTGEDKIESVILYTPSSLIDYMIFEGSSNTCTIAILSEEKCNDFLKIDRNKKILWPNTIITTKESPGEHTVYFPSKIHNSTSKIKFECKNGDMLYFTARCKTEIEGSPDFSIEKNDKIPDGFINCPVLIWRDGNWLIDNY